MHWNLNPSPNAKRSCFYLCGEHYGFLLRWVTLLWFMQLVNVSDLFLLVSSKFVFCFLFVFVSFCWFLCSPVKKTIRSGKNKRKQNFIVMLNKDKAKMSPASTMKRDWGLGNKRWTWNFSSLGLCVSIWQHLYKAILGCPIRNTKPFVLCDLNFV